MCKPSETGPCSRCRKRKQKCSLAPQNKMTGMADRRKMSAEEVLRFRLEQQGVSRVRAIIADEGQDAPRPSPSPSSEPVSADITDIIPAATDTWADQPSIHAAHVSTSNSGSATATHNSPSRTQVTATVPDVSTLSSSVIRRVRGSPSTIGADAATGATSAPEPDVSAGAPAPKCILSVSNPKPSGVIAPCCAPPLLVPLRAQPSYSDTSQERNEDLAARIAMLEDEVDKLKKWFKRFCTSLAKVAETGSQIGRNSE